MISNYFQIAIRNMRRNLRFTLLHLVGLALAFTAVILISWYIYDELSWDELKDADRVYRVSTHWGSDVATGAFATTPPPLAAVIKQEVPEVEKVARAFNWNHSTMRLPAEETTHGTPVVFRETRIFIVDPEFLEVLQYPALWGNPQKAFDIPESIVLTKQTAIRYFGEEAVASGSLIGKSILFGGDQTARIVTAVVDPPQNTHLHFDMLVNINFGYTELDTLKAWTWNIMHTYVKVNTSVAHNQNGLDQLQSRLSGIAARFIAPSEELLDRGEKPDFHLQPIRNIHLHSQLQREHEANADYLTVQLLAGIAVLIVMLACANYVNLFTAQSLRRLREIGVRKTLGSNRQSLAIQFFMESALYVVAAALLSLSLAEVSRRPFNYLVGKQLDFSWTHNMPLLIGFVALLVFVILLAGSYPSLYLSTFNPVSALKGKVASQRSTLRNGLVVFQFGISIALMVCSVFILQQLNFLHQRAPGYDRENVVIVKNDREIQDKWQEFRNELESNVGISAVSFSTGIPSYAFNAMRDFRRKGDAVGTGMHVFLVDDRYIAALGLSLQSGSNFTASAEHNRRKIILNESAVRELGLENPLGAVVVLNEGDKDEEQLEVIGVVRDFNIESLHTKVKPLVLYYYIPDAALDYIAVRIRAGNPTNSLERIENTWRKFEPENPFIYSFLDQDFERQYVSEKRLARLFTVFTVLTISIALLGLTGLASYMSEQRTKEVSVRKVLGASTGGIMVLFSKDFTRLALTSMALAVPTAYFVMTLWLNEFTDRISLTPMVFIACCVSTLALIWATVSLISLRVARVNPALTLKNE